MLYRLYTEDKNREGIEQIISKYFDGFTLIPAIGYWKGNKEQSLIVEILSDKDVLPVVEQIAEEIKRVNDQQSVLIFSNAGNEPIFV